MLATTVNTSPIFWYRCDRHACDYVLKFDQTPKWKEKMKTKCRKWKYNYGSNSADGRKRATISETSICGWGSRYQQAAANQRMIDISGYLMKAADCRIWLVFELVFYRDGLFYFSLSFFLSFFFFLGDKQVHCRQRHTFPEFINLITFKIIIYTPIFVNHTLTIILII